MIGKDLRKIIQQLILMFWMLKNKKYLLLLFQNMKHVILLMIPNGEKLWYYYLAVKKLSALLREVTSKYYADFFCLNCLHSFRTRSKLESHKTVCKNKGFCNVSMPSEDTKMLQFNQYQKSDQAPFIISADLECLIEDIDGCKIILNCNCIYNKSKGTYSIRFFNVYNIKISMMFIEVKIV